MLSERKPGTTYPEFVEDGTDAGIPDGIDMATAGQLVETFADDDPPDTNPQFDFSVKKDNAVSEEENTNKFEQEWTVANSSKHTAQKRRTEGGRAFVTKSVGGIATLRITAS
jgi:hypothetical protein